MYVLSIVRPPENGAAFGKAWILPGTGAVWTTARAAGNVLHHGHLVGEADTAAFVTDLENAPVGTPRTHTPTGLTFRIDPADNPPNVCPCCGRLVKPGDHAFAGQEDALCTGCYTWDDSTQCLSENTAHADRPGKD